jgi:hypothetical protein
MDKSQKDFYRAPSGDSGKNYSFRRKNYNSSNGNYSQGNGQNKQRNNYRNNNNNSNFGKSNGYQKRNGGNNRHKSNPDLVDITNPEIYKILSDPMMSWYNVKQKILPEGSTRYYTPSQNKN